MFFSLETKEMQVIVTIAVISVALYIWWRYSKKNKQPQAAKLAKQFTRIEMPGSINAFMSQNGSWKLDVTIEDCDNLFVNRPKLFIIGPYKVGKTSLVNWILNDPVAKPDSINNTRGEYIFHGSVLDKEIVIVDTEGLFQPVIGAEPHIMREFIIEQTMNTATQVLFVLDLLHDQELSLLNLLIHSFARSHNSVTSFFVIHNRKDLIQTEKVREYRDLLLKYFSNGGHSARLEKGHIVQSVSTNRSVCHYVLGNANAMVEHNNEQIGLLRKNISSDYGSTITFSQGLKIALRHAMTKYYQIRLDDQITSFIEIKPNSKELKVTHPVNPRTKVSSEWRPISPVIELGEPFKTEEGKWYQVVYIACPGLIQRIPNQVDNSSKTILDGSNLFCEKIVKKATKKQDYNELKRDDNEIKDSSVEGNCQNTKQNQDDKEIKSDDLPKLIAIDSHTMQFQAKILMPGDDQFNLMEIFQNISFPASILVDSVSVVEYNKNRRSNYGDICMFAVRITDICD